MSAIKKIESDSQSVLRSMAKGVRQLVAAVGQTLGPKGRYVAIETKGPFPIITKDGVTVAKEIVLEHPIENMGAASVRLAAEKAAERSGDGTTTTTVLAGAMIYAYSQRPSKSNPIDVRRGIEAALSQTLEIIEAIAIPVSGNLKTLKQVASVSANNDNNVGEIVSEAFSMAGGSGVVNVEPSRDSSTSISTSDGYQFNRGYASRAFITSEAKLEASQSNCSVLLYMDNVSKIEQIGRYMQESIGQLQKSFVLIAKSITDDALETMEREFKNRGVKCLAITAPEYGETMEEMMKDIASVTGGTILRDGDNIPSEGRSLDFSVLGLAESVTATSTMTTIIGSEGDHVTTGTRIDEITDQIETFENKDLVKVMEERVAKLSGGISTIRVGAATEVEMKEKFDRYEDAVLAVRAAMKGGVIAGGGIPLLAIHSKLHLIAKLSPDDKSDFAIGKAIFFEALKAPFCTISANAGRSPSNDVNKVLKAPLVSGDDIYNIGINFNTGDFGNLVNEGILDPAIVTIEALKAAVSVSCMIITTGATVTFKRKDEE